MTIPPGRSWKTLRWCQPTERGTSSGRATMRVVSRGNGSRGGPATARPSASYGKSSYNPGDENPPRVSDALRGIRRARKNTGRGEAEQRGTGRRTGIWNCRRERVRCGEQCVWVAVSPCGCGCAPGGELVQPVVGHRRVGWPAIYIYSSILFFPFAFIIFEAPRWQ
jgi:hypothetical protein